MALQKYPSHGVVVNLQDLDILMYVFAPENYSAWLDEICA